MKSKSVLYGIIILCFLFAAVVFRANFTQLRGDEINRNFDYAMTSITEIEIETQQLAIECKYSSSVSNKLENVASTNTRSTRTQLLFSTADLKIARDRLGQIISPDTYCAINEIIALSNAISTPKVQFLPKDKGSPTLSCSTTAMTDTQANNVIQMLNKDESKISFFTELFLDKTNKSYSETTCLGGKMQ